MNAALQSPQRGRAASTAIAEALAVSRRAEASARALFRDGLFTECHAYLVASCRPLLDAWQAEAEAPSADDLAPEQGVARALDALTRADYPHLERLRAALEAATDDRALPSSPSVTRPYRVDWIWAEFERLRRFTARKLAPAETRKRTRRRLAIALGLTLLVVIIVCARLWGRPRAIASEVYGEPWPVANVLDGIDATEWLLPDRKPGWVDVVLPSARDLHGVRLLNAHNIYYQDRGTRNVRVTAFSARGPLASVEGTFKAQSGADAKLDLALEAKQVTRVRVELLSHFGLGAGLAEVELR